MWAVKSQSTRQIMRCSGIANRQIALKCDIQLVDYGISLLSYWAMWPDAVSNCWQLEHQDLCYMNKGKTANRTRMNA